MFTRDELLWKMDVKNLNERPLMIPKGYCLEYLII
jgi:hypothetical protein